MEKELERNQVNLSDSEQVPVIVPEKKPNTGLIVTLLIAILLIGAGGVYAGTKLSGKQISKPTPTIAPQPTTIPASDETVRWKTYKSKCGFEFKYPPTWNVKPYFISDSENVCAYLEGPDYSQGLDDRTGMYISFDRFPLNTKGVKTIDDYVHLSEKYIEPKPSPIVATEKIYGTISGKQFIGEGFEPGITFAFLKDGYIYDVNRSEETNEKYIDQILSTFKFTDQKTDETANWKTCVNSKDKFTIAYPVNFDADPATCNYAIMNYDLVKEINVSDPSADFRKNWLLTITAEKTSVDVTQWIKDKCSVGSPGCSQSISGPIVNSKQFDLLNVHYAETDTVVKVNDTIFDFSLNARNPNTMVSQDIRKVYGQILSTFKFLD